MTVEIIIGIIGILIVLIGFVVSCVINSFNVKLHLATDKHELELRLVALEAVCFKDKEPTRRRKSKGK